MVAKRYGNPQVASSARRRVEKVDPPAAAPETATCCIYPGWRRRSWAPGRNARPRKASVTDNPCQPLSDLMWRQSLDIDRHATRLRGAIAAGLDVQACWATVVSLLGIHLRAAVRTGKIEGHDLIVAVAGNAGE